jgi:hypothetical protein
LTDTTIQEKEHRKEFERLRQILDSSSSLDDFLGSVDRGIMQHSQGISGLTLAGRRSLAKWFDFRSKSTIIVKIPGTFSRIDIRRTFVNVKGHRQLRYRNAKTGKFVSKKSGLAIYRLKKNRMNR